MKVKYFLSWILWARLPHTNPIKWYLKFLHEYTGNWFKQKGSHLHSHCLAHVDVKHSHIQVFCVADAKVIHKMQTLIHKSKGKLGTMSLLQNWASEWKKTVQILASQKYAFKRHSPHNNWQQWEEFRWIFIFIRCLLSLVFSERNPLYLLPLFRKYSSNVLWFLTSRCRWSPKHIWVPVQVLIAYMQKGQAFNVSMSGYKLSYLSGLPKLMKRGQTILECASAKHETVGDDMVIKETLLFWIFLLSCMGVDVNMVTTRLPWWLVV